jgi:hypothetical protein
MGIADDGIVVRVPYSVLINQSLDERDDIIQGKAKTIDSRALLRYISIVVFCS